MSYNLFRPTTYYLTESERIVVFQSGKVSALMGPGHILLLPLIQHPKKVDLREHLLEIKEEPCLTHDKLLITVRFYMAWQIDDPILSLIKVSDVKDSISLHSAAVLHTTIAEYTLDETLEKQQDLNALIYKRIVNRAEDWGVRVNSTEILELRPPTKLLKQIENRLKSRLESDSFLANTDAQIEAIRRLMALGVKVDDQVLTILGSSAKNHTENISSDQPKNDIPTTEISEDQPPQQDTQKQEIDLASIQNRMSILTLIVALTVPIAATLILYVAKILPSSSIFLWLTGTIISYAICLTNENLRNNQILPVLLSIITNLISTLMSQQLGS